MKPIPVSYGEIMDSTPWASLRAFSPDIVIGVERGGMVLAAIAAFRLNAALATVRASLYDDSKPAKEKSPEPKIEQSPASLPSLAGKRVLVVDDVCNTGRTLAAVTGMIRSAGAKEVRTFVYAGSADFSCRPFEQCLKFPWEPITFDSCDSAGKSKGIGQKP
jgi:hypoxanthine phosphoribosyltransferase